MTLPAWTEQDAHFPDPQHRVWLRRHIGGTKRGPAVFILHNPFTAGGTSMEDPTSRRGISFATTWGCSDLIFVNAATGIATNADDLVNQEDPIGLPLANDAILYGALLAERQNGRLIAA